MNEYKILNELFNNKTDEIFFQNFYESNIIELNNDNKGNYNNNRLIFNTRSISSKLIDYSNAYTVIIAKVREVRENSRRNRLIWRIIQLWCFHHYHIVVSHNTT